MSKSPSFNVDRVRWNRVWENELAKIYGSRDIPSYTGSSAIDGAGMRSMWNRLAASDATVQTINTMVKEVATLQRDLSRKAALRYAEDDFESKWKTCTPETREKWILEGLVRTCQASPDFEERRKACPEVTLLRLNKSNGQPFLNLLQALCLENIDEVPSNPKPLPSDSFDRMNGHKLNIQNPGRQLVQLAELTQRTYFLVMFVWNVLLAFYGESETFGLQSSQNTDHSNAAIERVAVKMGMSQEDVAEIASEVHSNHLQAERHCQNCKLPASRIKGVTVLVACARCKSIGRLVYYCGRSCQVNDYKNGNPPHKQVCGNKGALLDATLLLSGSNAKF